MRLTTEMCQEVNQNRRRYHGDTSETKEPLAEAKDSSVTIYLLSLERPIDSFLEGNCQGYIANVSSLVC